MMLKSIFFPTAKIAFVFSIILIIVIQPVLSQTAADSAVRNAVQSGDIGEIYGALAAHPTVDVNYRPPEPDNNMSGMLVSQTALELTASMCSEEAMRMLLDHACQLTQHGNSGATVIERSYLTSTDIVWKTLDCENRVNLLSMLLEHTDASHAIGNGCTMCTDRSGYSLIRKVVTAALNSQDLTNEVKQEYETVINIMSASDSEFINSEASSLSPVRGGCTGLTALHVLGDPGVNENRALELEHVLLCNGANADALRSCNGMDEVSEMTSVAWANLNGHENLVDALTQGCVIEASTDPGASTTTAPDDSTSAPAPVSLFSSNSAPYVVPLSFSALVAATMPLLLNAIYQ